MQHCAHFQWFKIQFQKDIYVDFATSKRLYMKIETHILVIINEHSHCRFTEAGTRC